MPIYKYPVHHRTNDPRDGRDLKDTLAPGFRHLKSIQVQDLFFIEGQLSQNESQQLALELLSDPVTQAVSWVELSPVVEALSTPESDSAIVAGGQAVMLGSMLEEAPNHQLSQR